MTRRLRTALRSFLRDWRLDLPRDWQRVMAEVELDFAGVDDDLEIHEWEPIFPSRKQARLEGAPAGAHLFRAFDGLAPQSVRCVVVGQDPYPSLSFSTGRAFESGEHRQWRDLGRMRSPSMRCMVQSLYAFRSGCADYASGVDAWPRTLEAIERSGNGLASPGELAQSWVDQGVLLLNSSLTISRFSVSGDPHQTRGHLPLWRPFVSHLLGYFARRCVFILMGDVACEAGARAGLVGNGGAHPLSRVVVTAHPASGDAFLSGPNPFEHSNQLLTSLGAPPILW